VKPVEIVGRVVKADGNALLPKSGDNFRSRISAERSVHDVERSRCRRKHAKTGVMLSRENDILHARQPGQNGPVAWVESLRIETPGQLVDEALQIGLRSPNHRMTDGRPELTVEAPMDEQAKTSITEPLDSLCAIVVHGTWLQFLRGS